MALITELLAQYTQFPLRLDTFLPAIDGQSRASATSAEFVNRLEAMVQALESYCQYQVRVVESASVAGDRILLQLSQTAYLDCGAGGKDQLAWELQLQPEQVKLLGGDPFRKGNLILASVHREDAASHYRAAVRPLPPDRIELTIDDLDTSQKITTGTYRVNLTLIGG